MRYAGFWKRSAAYGWDCILVTGVAVLPMLFVRFPTFEQILTSDPAAMRWFDLFGDWYFLVSAAYNILLVAGPKRATLGKAHCGIAVVTLSGERLSLVQSALRHAASGISMLCGGLGYLTMFFRADKAALHDILCQTRVVMRESA